VCDAHVGELWWRTVIGIRRELARRKSPRRVAAPVLRQGGGVQRRGVVHLHALLRLDGVDADDRDRIVSPAGVALGDLVDAVRHAAQTASVQTRTSRNRLAGGSAGMSGSTSDRCG
jgi:hypothetical protein